LFVVNTLRVRVEVKVRGYLEVREREKLTLNISALKPCTPVVWW
jgi:hypothetical protein